MLIAVLAACGSGNVGPVTSYPGAVDAGSGAMADGAQGALDAGACQVHDAGPMELGDFSPPDGSFATVAALAADDDGVYVVIQASEASFTVDRVQIYRVPPCGGSATLLGSRTAPAMTGGTYGALAASQRVFVVMGDGVYSVPTSGGPMTTETTSGVLFNALAVYGNQFYWIDPAATLWALTTGGGNVPRALAHSATPASWTSLAVDATYAYVTATPVPSDGGVISPAEQAQGSVLAVALSNGDVTTLASGITNPGTVLAAGGALYWTTFAPGFIGVDTISGTFAIERMALPAGPVASVIVAENGVPALMGLDGTTLHWLINGGAPFAPDTVRALPAGGVPTTLVMPQAGGGIIAGGGFDWYTNDNRVFGLRF